MFEVGSAVWKCDTAGVSNSWASGGHIVCLELCRGQHEICDLEITAILGNDFSNGA